MDKILTCQDCGNEFIFTQEQQEFFSDRGFPDPIRCPACRKLKKQRYIGRQNERHDEY